MKHIYITLLPILFSISACSFGEDVSAPALPDVSSSVMSADF
ncbi:hypothetical protein [Sutcliffiella horikoshii]